MYDVDYFILKFEAIPEERWLSRHFRMGDKACVMGHCDFYNKERDELERLFGTYSHLFTPLNWLKNGNRWPEQAINNGDDPLYQQPTPKQRILAALYDIKNAENGKEIRILGDTAIEEVNRIIAEGVRCLQ